jgi:hypothetical protein
VQAHRRPRPGRTRVAPAEDGLAAPSVTVAALNNWWVPYFSGAASGEVTPETYEAEYSGNLRLLPPVSDHPVVPDVQHTLIHLGLLTSAVLSWTAFLTMPRRPR